MASPTLAQFSLPTGKQQDVVGIKQLALPKGVKAPDVWNRLTEQPAFLSLSLLLRNGFNSSANQDSLDDSTIHYGLLAKAIRKLCAESESIDAVFRHVLDTTTRADERKCAVRLAIVEMHLPKAAMYGEEVIYRKECSVDEEGRTVVEKLQFGVEGIKVMTLLGINACERTGRQPVTANMWLQFSGTSIAAASRDECTMHLFGLERVLAKVLEDTDFETLEALVNFAADRVEESMRMFGLEGVTLFLSFEKPRAILAASAPAISIVRQLSGSPTGDLQNK